MLLHCDACTAAYPPDSPRCPQCGSTEAHPANQAPEGVECPHCDPTADDEDDEDDMAKNTVHGGPTNINATPPVEPDQEPVGDAGPEVIEVVDDAVVITADDPVIDLDGQDDDEVVDDEPEDESPHEVEADTDTGDGAGDEEADPAGRSATRPAGNASKVDWFDYCQSLGAELTGTADDFTRDDLIATADALGG